MEGYEQRWKDDFDRRQRDDHDSIVRHDGCIEQSEKDHNALAARVTVLEVVVNKLSTDKVRLIAYCVGGATVAGIIVKAFWPK